VESRHGARYLRVARPCFDAVLSRVATDECFKTHTPPRLAYAPSMLPRIAGRAMHRVFSTRAAVERMRAVQVTAKVGCFDDSCKGCFDVLELPRPPPPAPGDVVVRVHRAQINPSDSSFFKVAPYPNPSRHARPPHHSRVAER
jgi:hypothetical protein